MSHLEIITWPDGVFDFGAGARVWPNKFVRMKKLREIKSVYDGKPPVWGYHSIISILLPVDVFSLWLFQLAMV